MTVEERRNNQSEEDYLESILILSDRLPVVHRIEVARRLGVSQAAVNKAVKLLCARGYVYEDGKHLYLTENGRAYASSVYEKHCIIRDYLIDRGVSPAAAESDACKMEHLVSEETFLMMKNAVAARRG
ncbi:MAG TPA: metal-dependent transcriptional regulator [Candidatus Scatosoma pullicola]|nr:metal-dependent transcriptional regulator [Candidatus Scatosoma pullicola]